MKRFSRFFDLVPLMLLWLMLSIFLWSFVFNILTDTAPENKIVLFADAPLTDDTGLAVLLEEVVEAPVEMVQVRSFSYAMMDSREIENADLYIVSADQVETYREWFAPLPDELQNRDGLLALDGVPYGVKVFDAAAGKGVAAGHIAYAWPGREDVDYYLFFGRSSLHVLTNENASDDQATACALRLLDIP